MSNGRKCRVAWWLDDNQQWPCLIFDSAVSRLRSRVTLSHKENSTTTNKRLNFLDHIGLLRLPFGTISCAETRARRIFDLKRSLNRHILRTPKFQAFFGSMPWSHMVDLRCSRFSFLWRLSLLWIFLPCTNCALAYYPPFHHSIPLIPQGLTTTGRPAGKLGINFQG